MGGRRGILKFIGNLLNIFMSVWIVLLYFDFFFQNSEIAEFCSVLFSCIEEKKITPIITNQPIYLIIGQDVVMVLW